MGVQLRLFGKPTVVSDGVTVHLPTDRRYQLLIMLALRGVWVGRDEAAALLWPEHGNAQARRNLRKVLHDAAALPWATGASLQGTALRWQVATDVAEFERHLDARAIEAALEISRQPLLEGFDSASGAFADWLDQQRLRLAERRRGAALLALGDKTLRPAQRLNIARRMLAIDPLDEDALAGELQALLADDQPMAARHAYNAYCARLAEAVGAEPSARLRALLEPSTPSTPGASMDSPVAFVGRGAEIAQLQATLLHDECRVLTVLGPGGIGKSRLAKSALATLEPRFADGALRVLLDDLPSIDDVAPRFARLARLELSGAAPARDEVARWLAPRTLLVLLDNAEHLDGLPALIEHWSAAAPRVKWLITSRRRLALEGERLMPLRGLALPDGDTPPAVAASDAGRLFIQRARQAKPAFDATRAAADIARLVRTLGGLPLAIELSAAWVRLLPVRELADDVASSLNALQQAEEGEERPEHRSVQATFQQSWRLLAPAEQRALAGLSVFAGSFSHVAALAVAGAGVALLSSLADKSLLQVEIDVDTESARLSLHPVMRRFVRSGVAQAADERRDLAARHARYHARWLADIENTLRGPRQAEALLQIEQQLPDCHAAWGHAVDRLNTPFVEQATLALMYYYEARGRRADGITLFADAERAFERGGDACDAALAMLDRALSTLRFRAGDNVLTIDTAGRGITRARRSGARAALKGCLLNFGLGQWRRGQPQAAVAGFEEGLQLAQADHDLPGIGAFVNSLAALEQLLGNTPAAERHYREALRVNRELNSPRGITTSLNNLGLLLLESERAAEALPLFEEGLHLCRDHGIGVMRGNLLLGLGWARLSLGQLPAARELTLQAFDAALDGGEPHVAAEAQMQLARIALAGGDAITAGQHARHAVRQAQPQDNPTVLLNAICCVAEAHAGAGSVRAAVALWLFVAEHPQTNASHRCQARASIDNAVLDAGDRAWAEQCAQGYELVNLAQALGADDEVSRIE